MSNHMLYFLHALLQCIVLVPVLVALPNLVPSYICELGGISLNSIVT